MKDTATWFEDSDFIALMAGKTDRSISFTETIVYVDAEQLQMFSDTYIGTVVDSPRGSGISIENVAEFEGKTLGERRDEGGFSHDPEDYIWYQFARWYAGEKDADCST